MGKSIGGVNFPKIMYLLALLYLVATPFVFGMFVFKAIKSYRIGRTPPKMVAAKDTIHTFFRAISLGNWNIAYNCLTDNAQQDSVVGLARLSYLQQHMPAVTIDSVQTLKKYWEAVPLSYKTEKTFYWEPWLVAMQVEPIDPKTYKITIPFRIFGTTVENDLLIRKHAALNTEASFVEFRCPFVVVERGGYWFLCNGWFWPDSVSKSEASG
jgi:hypothetical protein